MQVVVDIDGDGSFLMNCQELATAAIENMDIKMFILNNQHLGMVVQWEDRFYKVCWPCYYLYARCRSQRRSPMKAWCCRLSSAIAKDTNRRTPESSSMSSVLQANRAHTYLGLREKEYHVSGDLKDIYPDFVMMANAFGVKAKRISKPEELRPAIKVSIAPFCLER